MQMSGKRTGLLSQRLVEIPSRWYGHHRSSHVRVIVIHSTESPEATNGARNVARYFQTAKKAVSAHVVVDNKQAIRCVADNKAAWTAPGTNIDGLQIELVGTAKQSKYQWKDKYSTDMLKLAAKIAADWCFLYNIPVVKLTVPQLIAGKRGFVGHVDVSKAYKKSDHYDPGPNFPWPEFLKLVENEINLRKA
jgi:N-acetyl-anhydromuramyl-L-alanine amidase AmpD